MVVLKDEDREPIASGLRRSLVGPLVSLQRGAERWRNAWVSSEQYQTTIDSRSLRGANSQSMKSENDQLRKPVGLGARPVWRSGPAEGLRGSAQRAGPVSRL